MNKKVHETNKADFLKKALQIEREATLARQRSELSPEKTYNTERSGAAARYDRESTHEMEKLRELTKQLQDRKGYENPESARAAIAQFAMQLHLVLAADLGSFMAKFFCSPDSTAVKNREPKTTLQNLIKLDPKTNKLDLTGLKQFCDPATADKDQKNFEAVADNWLADLGYKKQPDDTYKRSPHEVLNEKAFNLLPPGLDEYLKNMDDADFDAGPRP